MKIYLCRITDFNITQENVIDFSTRANQDKYFSERTKFTIDSNYQADSTRTFIVVKKNLFELMQINYVYFIGLDGKKYYYFVMEKQFKTEDSSYLFLKLDVWQTYLFDYDLMESFIDRCHVPRWDSQGNPTKEYEPESLNYGEKILVGYDDLCSMGTGIVFATTTPIGKIGNTGGGDGSGEGGLDCGDWQNGVMSADGFRFMKGYEGFGKYKYIDSGGVPTIGYGCTASEPNEFNEMVANQPVSEEHASKVSYEVKQRNYGKPIVNFCKEIGVTKQNQFDALCDLAFNAGVGAVLGTPQYTSLPNALKTDPFNESYVRPIWENYLIRDNHGTIQEGLRDRRKAQCDIYFKAVYEKRPIVTINANGSYGPAITENNGNGWLPTCTAPVEGKFVDNKAGDNWLVPTTGQLTGLYPKYPSGNLHNGLDIGCPVGTPVRASKDGVVIDRQELTTSYGKFLKIQSGDSIVIYAHNSELLVNIGDHVKQGQLIAKSGNTGNSQGPHLHWEIRNDNVGEVILYNTKTVNPYPNAKLYEEV